MFGLSRNDATQQQIVKGVRDGLMPYRDGYAIKVSRSEPPIAITSKQRDIVFEAYAAALRRAIWAMLAIMLLSLAGLFALLACAGGELHFWAMLIIMAGSSVTMLWPRRALQSAVAKLGPRPRVPAVEYNAFQRQRLRERSWSTIVLPPLSIPFLAWRLGMNLPPRETDDYVEIVLLAGLLSLCLWTAVRKARAGPA